MATQVCMTPAQVELSNTLRRLWMEHVLWTRAFIESTFADSGDLEQVTERLLRNPADFAAALTPIYGETDAGRFEEFFRDHLLIAAALVNAAKAGDMGAYNEQRVKWYENANDIANFLAEINPNWDEIDWQTMMYDHLYMTEVEAMQIAGNEYGASINQFDQIQQQALHMADDMTRGIIAQFPAMFG